MAKKEQKTNAMLVRHFRNTILAELKLIDFSLFYRSLSKGLLSVVSPTQVGR